MKFNVLCPICSGCPSAGALHSFTFWSRTSEFVCIAKCTQWPHECCLLPTRSVMLIRFPMQAMEEVRKIKPKRTLFTGTAASAFFLESTSIRGVDSLAFTQNVWQETNLCAPLLLLYATFCKIWTSHYHCSMFFKFYDHTYPLNNIHTVSAWICRNLWFLLTSMHMSTHRLRCIFFQEWIIIWTTKR